MQKDKDTNKRPALTAESAKSFSTFSMANYSALKMSLPCGCEPYKDVFTFNRWRAQGFQVCKGSKAVKLPLVIEREVKDKTTGEVVGSKRFIGGSAVFCRCQVKPIEEASPELPLTVEACREAYDRNTESVNKLWEEVRRG